MHDLGLIILCDITEPVVNEPAINGWAGPRILVGRGTSNLMSATVRFNVRHDRSVQQLAWHAALDGAAGLSTDKIDRLAFAFRLSAPVIADIARSHGSGTGDTLWAAARSAAAPINHQLIDCVIPHASLDQLILPAEEADTLATIVGAARMQHRVVGDWGFGAQSGRGIGIAALFSGESGTGKTMAAEAIAKALDLDLYRVEVSAVVSKYIGETEKNLRRIFSTAEAGGGVLLFDEADTLFGKRSDVKDAHDRYANMEVGYLLQLMESFAGIAILTTNMDDALDRAFMRRLRFVVRFPLPGQAERMRIWAGAFPANTPIGVIDTAALARLSLTGGTIRNIALGAAFRAAAADEAVSMAHILVATRAEYVKLGRPLADIDQRSWA